MSPQNKVLGSSFAEQQRSKVSSPKSVNMISSQSIVNKDTNSRRSNFARAGHSISSVSSVINDASRGFNEFGSRSAIKSNAYGVGNQPEVTT